MFLLKNYLKINQAAGMLYASFSRAVAADTLIAVSLCTILIKSRTGFKRYAPLALGTDMGGLTDLHRKNWHNVDGAYGIQYQYWTIDEVRLFALIDLVSWSNTHEAFAPLHVLSLCVPGCSSHAYTILTQVDIPLSGIQYTVWPERLVFVGIYFALSKLYINSLLASLNARSVIRPSEEFNWDASLGMRSSPERPMENIYLHSKV